MSRLLRVGDKVINLDNIEYITREESSVVRIHFVHRDIELWNEQGEAFRQWVLVLRGLWRRLVGVGIIGPGLLGAPAQDRTEDAMDDSSYWYIGVSPISVPYWSDVTMYEAEVGEDRVAAPMLFTSRGRAVAELREHQEAEADSYLRLVEEYGDEAVGEALDNTPEQQIFEISASLLGEHLKDSDHMYVMVDGRVRLAWELAEELGDTR